MQRESQKQNIYYWFFRLIFRDFAIFGRFNPVWAHKITVIFRNTNIILILKELEVRKETE